MDSGIQHLHPLMSRTAYPLVLGIAFLLHYLFIRSGLGIAGATYIPVLLAAILITLLEWRHCHRGEWKPGGTELWNDALFMAVVQGILPRFLSFLVVLGLTEVFQTQSRFMFPFWPHAWPIPVQAVLMVFVADFFRYWLHRLCHEWPALWRLHAVHHSPHNLYWLNVGRFHPVEKLFQFLFDALPFILMGVSEEVLALYFLFYSINGFFQHCNIELHLGYLNYLISGPELHRWHHSYLPKEANHNYGNNVIVWDLLFGTWFLPQNRQVGPLGLKNRRYPMGFLDQMNTPFMKGLDQG